MDFSFPGIAHDIVQFRVLLREAMTLVNRPPQICPSILNLACGRADETGALLDTLSEDTSGGEYLGLDLRQAEIHEARRRWGDCWRPYGTVEFRVADVSISHQLPGEKRYDFIFLRHQNYWDAPAIWDQIYRHALARLKQGGLLMFTSYFDREHELAIAAVKTLGAVMWLDLPHAKSRALADAPGKSVDKRLAVFGPPGEGTQRI